MPWIAATASRLLGSQSPTRSPRPTPQRASRVARRSAASAERGEGQRPAVLVLDGRVVGPPRGGRVQELAEMASVHERSYRASPAQFPEPGNRECRTSEPGR